MGSVSYRKILLGVCVALLVIKFMVQRSGSTSVVQRSGGDRENEARVQNPRMSGVQLAREAGKIDPGDTAARALDPPGERDEWSGTEPDQRHIDSAENQPSHRHTGNQDGPEAGQGRLNTPEERPYQNGQEPGHRLVAYPEDKQELGGLGVQGEAPEQNTDLNLKGDLRLLKKGIKTLKNCSYFDSSSQVENHTCRDSACSEYLDGTDWIYYKDCISKTLRINRSPFTCERLLSLNGKCRFMDGSKRAPVALVSLPGSGNTWARGLLEQATGLCTGAQYCDPSIRGVGFTGEQLQSGAVVVVKTHYHRLVMWTDTDKPIRNNTMKHPSYGSAVLIIRNPFDAFVADWQRFTSKKLSQGTHHVDVLNHTYFGTYPGWIENVKTKTTIWREFFSSWVIPAHRGHHPLHVVRYEDLKLDTFGEVRKILDFLGLQYSPDQVKKNLELGFSTFKRKKRGEFEHYTPGQKALVRDCISKALGYLRKHNNGVTYGIESYLNR